MDGWMGEDEETGDDHTHTHLTHTHTHTHGGVHTRHKVIYPVGAARKTFMAYGPLWLGLLECDIHTQPHLRVPWPPRLHRGGSLDLAIYKIVTSMDDRSGDAAGLQKYVVARRPDTWAAGRVGGYHLETTNRVL